MSGYKDPLIQRSSHANGNGNSGIVISFSFLRYTKMYKIVLAVLVVLILTPLIVQFFVANVSRSRIRCEHVLMSLISHSQDDTYGKHSDIRRSKKSYPESYEDLNNFQAFDIKLRIEEMLRIKVNLFRSNCLSSTYSDFCV